MAHLDLYRDVAEMMVGRSVSISIYTYSRDVIKLVFLQFLPPGAAAVHTGLAFPSMQNLTTVQLG